MICPDCKGGDENCLRCNGYGEVCDICGEATDEPGQSICDECRADNNKEDN